MLEILVPQEVLYLTVDPNGSKAMKRKSNQRKFAKKQQNCDQKQMNSRSEELAYS